MYPSRRKMHMQSKNIYCASCPDAHRAGKPNSPETALDIALDKSHSKNQPSPNGQTNLLRRSICGLVLLTLLFLPGAGHAAVFHFDVPPDQRGIPDGDQSGVLFNGLVSGLDASGIAQVKVFLDLEGNPYAFNGDYYVYLLHNDKKAILLNRVGTPENVGLGYPDDGFNITFDDLASNGDIHLYRHVVIPQGLLTGDWAPDGRNVSPSIVLADTPRTALLDQFIGAGPNGTWSLFLLDGALGGEGKLVSWGLDITMNSSTNINAVAITAPPQSQTAIVRTNVTLSVSATGTAPIFYQWRFNGATLPDATNATLPLVNVQFAQAGTYSVVVSNSVNSATSDGAVLTVLAALKATAGEGGSVQRNPDQPAYNANTVVQLTAIPSDGFMFNGWTGDLSGTNNPASVTMNDNKNIAATFAPLPRVAVVALVRGQGSIQLDPQQASYLAGTSISVTANPSPGYGFFGWQGDLTGTANPASLVVQDKDISVTAVFAPILHPLANQTVNELTPLSYLVLTNPPSTVRFSLEPGAPAGAAIDPTNGLFTWTPTEAQGPSTNLIGVRATDAGPSGPFATTSFSVVVNEVNTAPVLAPIGDITVLAGDSVTFTATATDADLPANTLTFSLASAPTGASINPNSGVFNWTPLASQAGTNYTVAVVVTDNGTPPLSATQTFLVTVSRPADIKLTALPVFNGQFSFRVDGESGSHYILQSSTNLIEWTDFLGTNTTTASFIWVDPNPPVSLKFYRVRRP
jgi:uncharacterized repeat protein (TIGR02543 family)